MDGIIMKKFSKIAAALILGGALVGNAFATSNVTYGVEKALAKTKANANTSVVHLYNHTDDTYTAYATFEPSGDHWTNDLGYYGSKNDSITYTIRYPDDEVCLKVVRDADGWVPYNDCYYNSDLYIEPSAVAGGKPVVKVVKN